MAEPVLAYDQFHGLLHRRNAYATITIRCITEIEANREVCAESVHNSVVQATALSPVFGYARSAKIAE